MARPGKGRTKRVTVYFTESEHDRLQRRAGNIPLSEYIAGLIFRERAEDIRIKPIILVKNRTGTNPESESQNQFEKSVQGG